MTQHAVTTASTKKKNPDKIYLYVHIMQIYFTVTYNVIRLFDKTNASLKKKIVRWFHVE